MKEVDPHHRFRRGSQCDDCPSACCWYCLIEIQDGGIITAETIDVARYYLMHGIMITTTGANWNAYVKGKCENLGEKDGKTFCKKYKNRPDICKDHVDCNEKNLFLHGDFSGDLMFENLAEFDKWLDKSAREYLKIAKKRGRK